MSCIELLEVGWVGWVFSLCSTASSRSLSLLGLQPLGNGLCCPAVSTARKLLLCRQLVCLETLEEIQTHTASRRKLDLFSLLLNVLVPCLFADLGVILAVVAGAGVLVAIGLTVCCVKKK